MTAPGAFEIEEPEPVEASHLIKTQCRTCGAPTLAVAEHLCDASCGACLWDRVSAGKAGGEIGVPGPVVARWRSEQPSGGGAEFWHKDAKSGVWSKVMPPEVIHPAPEQVGGEMPSVMPDAVLRLSELAREAGWEVGVTYARGTGVHGSTGRPTSLRHSLAVRCHHPLFGLSAVALYVRPVTASGTWSRGSVWLWGPSLPHFRLAGFTELKEWLREGGQVGAEWYAAVRFAVAEAEEAGREQKESWALLKRLAGAGKIEDVCSELGVELEIGEVRALLAGKAKREAGG